MKLVVCCVRDVRADVFGTPFFMQSVGHAERSFGDEINRPAEDNVMYKHPEDFELFMLGHFDCQTGLFETFERVQLASGSAVVKALPNDKRVLPLGAV